ncbi:MAG TPA: hypothetical protein VFO95_01085 [Gemmatimonadales bacterium]|nr:hypothetical protein [Gemmatimonadales bacterium]
MSRIFSAVMALAVATALPVSIAAQDKPNFSGTWVLQTDKSDYGMMPPPMSRTDIIDHQEPKITIKRTAATGEGENKLDLVYAVDGKPWKNQAGEQEVTSTLHWEGQELVVVSEVDTPQGLATLTDRWSLSADGKTLTQNRTISIQGQELKQTMVLAKQ